MKRDVSRSRWSAASALIVALVLLSGCSTWKSVKETTLDFSEKVAHQVGRIGKLEFTESGLRSVIAVGAVQTTTVLPDQNIPELFQQALVADLSAECGKVRVLQPGDPAYPEMVLEMTRKDIGPFDNFVLAQTARKLGLNGVLTGGLIDVREHVEERGFFWMRDTHHFLHVVVGVEVYDAGTAAKLVDESRLYEVEIDDLAYETSETRKEVLIPILEETIREAAAEMAEEVCDAVQDNPWTGFVLASEDGRVVLSAGSNVGIAEGLEFQVLDSSGILESGTGQRFFKPGFAIGTVRVTTVHEDHAQAEVLTGDEIPVGSMVRVP